MQKKKNSKNKIIIVRSEFRELIREMPLAMVIITQIESQSGLHASMDVGVFYL